MRSSRGRTWLTASGPDRELAGMVALSVFLHAVAAAALLVIPRTLLSPQPPPVVAYTVKIVDPSALGGRLPPGKVRPDQKPESAADAARGKPAPEPEKPKPAPEPEKAKAPPPEPKPEPKKPEPEKAEKPKAAKAPVVEKPPEKKPEPKTEPEPRPREEPKPASAARPKEPSAAEKAAKEREERDRRIQEAVRRAGQRGTAAEASGLGGTEEGEGKALGTGGDGGGGGILTGLDFIIYKNQVESIFKRNWTWVGSNPNLTVRVGFRIERDGQIRDVRIVESSGDSGYDRSVLRAVQGSELPAPPEKYRDVFADYLLDFVSGELQS